MTDKELFWSHYVVEESIKGVLEKSYINEKHGMPTGFKLYCDDFKRFLFDNISPDKESLIYEKTYEGDNFFKNLKVNLKRGDELALAYSPGFSLFNYSNGVFNRLFIHGTIPFTKDSIPYSVSLFAHELLHAYEDYSRQKNTRGSLSSYLIGTKYFTNLSSKPEVDVVDDLVNIIYFLNPAEKRAYITSAEVEIRERLGEVFNNKSVDEIVFSTQSWKNYEKVKDDLLNIINVRDNHTKDILVKNWNKRTTKKVSTFNRMVKMIEMMIFDYRDRFLRTVSKYVFDLIETGELFSTKSAKEGKRPESILREGVSEADVLRRYEELAGLV